MFSFLPWLALLLGVIGNCGFWLFCFNRVNAFGYSRPVAKLAEKVCIGLCFGIPMAVLWAARPAVEIWLSGDLFWPDEATLGLQIWLAWNLASLLILGPLWLESRRWLVPPNQLIRTDSQLYHVHKVIPGGSAANRTAQWWSRVPLNQWSHLEVTQKVLQLHRRLLPAHGLTIGHISDLHFTGQYSESHYHFVVDRLMELDADLIAISGDIIDFQEFLPLIDSVLGRISAPLGVYYVLGNHDRRLKDIRPLVQALADVGFHDLGVSNCRIQRGDLSILLTGNEHPWFQRHSLREDNPGAAPGSIDPEQNAGLRIGVAHSPDQIGWAKRNQLDLLLAGHTHGGQARFPLIGPLVAPSLHGSKFASGVFMIAPTIMHVSRGVAGTHTIRWRCPPEISLLTLSTAVTKEKF